MAKWVIDAMPLLPANSILFRRQRGMALFSKRKNNKKICKIANKKLDKVFWLAKMGIGLVASEQAWLIGGYEE